MIGVDSQLEQLKPGKKKKLNCPDCVSRLQQVDESDFLAYCGSSIKTKVIQKDRHQGH